MYINNTNAEMPTILQAIKSFLLFVIEHKLTLTSGAGWISGSWPADGAGAVFSISNGQS